LIDISGVDGRLDAKPASAKGHPDERSLVEIIAAKPTSAYDAKWGQFVVNPAFFTRLVYQGT
jgi:hypothetical protein